MTTPIEDMVRALRRAERKLSAYVGVCEGDTELTNTVLPMCRAALEAHDARAQAQAATLGYTPGELDRTAPARIWLQIDTSASNEDRDEPFPDPVDGVSWYYEEIGGLEIQYVRADLAQAQAATSGNPAIGVTYYVRHPDGSYSVAEPQPQAHPSEDARDAQRYRWLRQAGPKGDDLPILNETGWSTGAEFDETIDAAMNGGDDGE